MGKIHKALEKSVRERQDKSKSGSLASFGTRISAKEGAGGGKPDPAASAPVSQGPDLGTIHELLHESADAGFPKLSDKNDPTSKEINDAPAAKKAPFVSLPTAEKPKLSVNRIEKIITADLEFDKKDGLQKTSDTNVAQDTQNVIPADAPLTKTDLPGSANNEKISALTPNDARDKKIFVLEEKTLNKFGREEVADETVPYYGHRNDSADFDSDSINYSPVDNSLVALLRPGSYEAEQFKILRTNLLFPESGNSVKSILITSPAPNDGKSFVSANLAVSLALNQDRKVLLIDADVRRSQIQRIFGLNRVEKGICDFLTGRVPLTSLLAKTSLKNLVILPAGKLTRTPAELRSLEKLPKLLEELAAHFSEYFIVIDSAPPKLASETGVLARLVDSTVIVIKAGVTKREYVEDTIDLIDKEKIAGIVFNWHENRMSNYKKYTGKSGYYSK